MKFSFTLRMRWFVIAVNDAKLIGLDRASYGPVSASNRVISKVNRSPLYSSVSSDNFIAGPLKCKSYNRISVLPNRLVYCFICLEKPLPAHLYSNH